jgi:hypothetical protein
MEHNHSELENILRRHLQKEIIISVDGVEIKKGKFLLFQNNILANNFYYDLTIEKTKKIDIFKLPYPFKIEDYSDEGLLYLDYRIKTLVANDKHVSRLVNLSEKYADSSKPSKFADKIIEIEFI